MGILAQLATDSYSNWSAILAITGHFDRSHIS